MTDFSELKPYVAARERVRMCGTATTWDGPQRIVTCVTSSDFKVTFDPEFTGPWPELEMDE